MNIPYGSSTGYAQRGRPATGAAAIARRRAQAILLCLVAALQALPLCGCGAGRDSLPGRVPLRSDGRRQIRVAVIGGMVETGFWQAVASRFEDSVGKRYKIELVAMGPKPYLDGAFRKGQADLVTMHACDTILNLVADGYAVDPQPWLKNDLVIVGPKDDPAKIRGCGSAAEAFAKIVASGSPFVVHSSLGAQDVMREVLESAKINMPSDHLTMLFTDRAREVLKVAAEKHAYTLVGRIPFLNGKLPNAGLELMVRGDPQLRRPYVVATADPRRFPEANVEGAKLLAAFLRQSETQKWIGGFRVSQIDDQPLFFPIESCVSK
jgi:tungstate transport system substrate-binding protein